MKKLALAAALMLTAVNAIAGGLKPRIATNQGDIKTVIAQEATLKYSAPEIFVVAERVY